MNDKKPETERQLLLFLLDSVNSASEYHWAQARLKKLDARGVMSAGGGA